MCIEIIVIQLPGEVSKILRSGYIINDKINRLTYPSLSAKRDPDHHQQCLRQHWSSHVECPVAVTYHQRNLYGLQNQKLSSPKNLIYIFLGNKKHSILLGITARNNEQYNNGIMCLTCSLFSVTFSEAGASVEAKVLVEEVFFFSFPLLRFFFFFFEVWPPWVSANKIPSLFTTKERKVRVQFVYHLRMCISLWRGGHFSHSSSL